jgi:hypothetical protein
VGWREGGREGGREGRREGKREGKKAAEQRSRRRAVANINRVARRANSSVDFDCDGDTKSDGADGAALAHSDSDGADDSDSDGADDAFAAEPNDGARSPVAARGGGRSDSDNSNDGPGAADGDAAACSALYGSAVLTLCKRALQLLHDGGVRASTAAAAAPGARAHRFPCLISSC